MPDFAAAPLGCQPSLICRAHYQFRRYCPVLVALEGSALRRNTLATALLHDQNRTIPFGLIVVPLGGRGCRRKTIHGTWHRPIRLQLGSSLARLHTSCSFPLGFKTGKWSIRGNTGKYHHANLVSMEGKSNSKLYPVFVLANRWKARDAVICRVDVPSKLRAPRDFWGYDAARSARVSCTLPKIGWIPAFSYLIRQHAWHSCRAGCSISENPHGLITDSVLSLLVELSAALSLLRTTVSSTSGECGWQQAVLTRDVGCLSGWPPRDHTLAFAEIFFIP